VLYAEAALASMTGPNPPALALLDVNLPGMEIGQLLAAVRDKVTSEQLPIVLVADNVTKEWIDRMDEGIIDDLIPRSSAPLYWLLRVDTVLRAHKRTRELEMLRENASQSAQMDHLTGIYNRETILSMLFHETDRVQRMKSEMCITLFDIDDFGHWNSRLGNDACDDLLCQVAGRARRLLRSYDLLGRAGKDEFLIALPGCGITNATMLAERLRIDVFCSPYDVAGQAIRLSACFGIASSHGRSPVVVLHEAEEALQKAKSAGPESIQCFGEPELPAHAPVTLSSSSWGDELHTR
jgi:diguanylate cyclase (GGDEF)-like protein